MASCGIAHKDLKPANIMIADQYKLKLIDFGVAKKIDNLRENIALGTLPYMAPETLRGESTVESDIWAVGVICYILMTGNPPFNGEDEDEIG